MRKLFRNPDLQMSFEREGFVEMELLSSSAVASLIELHDSNSMELGEPPVSFTSNHPDSQRRRAISDGIRGVLAGVLDQVLEECRPVLGNFFCKQPSNTRSAVHMHQDWSFVDETQHDSLTVWCPLENISRESGTLSVVPGSHRLSRRPRGYVKRFPYPDLESVFRTRYSRQVTATPGCVVLFHQCLFHWSAPNSSSRRRLAANCFVAPLEAPIYYPHPDPDRHPDRIELFAADDALLSSFVVGRRPENAFSLGFVDGSIEPLGEGELDRLLGPLLKSP